MPSGGLKMSKGAGIPYTRVETALIRLAESDEQEAELRSLVEKTKEECKAKFIVIAAAEKEGTVMQREAVAYKHESYKSTQAAYYNALTEHGKVKNQRAHEVIVIDVWRSLNAARNKGQIV